MERNLAYEDQREPWLTNDPDKYVSYVKVGVKAISSLEGRSPSIITYTISYDPFQTIEEMKLQIYEETSISATLQLLIFAGKQLEDDRTLADYCIQYKSTFHLIVKEKEFESRSKKIDLDYTPHRLHPDLFTLQSKSFIRPDEGFSRLEQAGMLINDSFLDISANVWRLLLTSTFYKNM